MTQSLPSKQTDPEINSLVDITKKDFSTLSTSEMEQLMQKGVKQAKKRMHDKGIFSVASINNEIYEEFPEGTKKLRDQ